MADSNLKLNAAIRSLLASQWIDLQRIRFATVHGTVRFYGELCYLGAHRGNRSEASRIENLEQQVRRLKGIRKVYFDLQNWRKNANGEWECLEKPAGKSIKRKVRRSNSGHDTDKKTN